jgi:DNA-binding MarR family transcriptional regulator
MSSNNIMTKRHAEPLHSDRPVALVADHGQLAARVLMDTIPSVMGIIRSDMRLAAKGVFTVPQFRTLNHLMKHPQNNRELAEWMGVAPPTMSRMIDTLVKRGYLEKARDTSDLRQQTLQLTLEGRQEINRVKTVVNKKIALKFKKLSEDQANVLVQGIRLLGEAFK